MGLFKRIGDVFSANLNELVDHCEHPERMLKQAIREMEANVGRTLDAAARAIAQERLFSRQLDCERRETEACHRSAGEAVQRGDDGSARAALRLKGEHERTANDLAEQLAAARTLSERLRTQIGAMRLTLARARRKLLDLTTRKQAADARRRFASQLLTPALDGLPASNFERIAAQVEQAEAEADALLELLGRAETIEPTDAQIEAELNQLKQGACDVAR